MYITAAGYRATLAAVLVDDRRLVLASTVGSREGVHAITARLFKHESVLLMALGGGSRHVGLNPMSSYTSKGERLPCGRWHTLMYDRKLLESGYLVGRNLPHIQEQFFAWLNTAYELPLHKSWAGWLWDWAVAHAMITPLEGFGMMGAKVKTHHLLEQAVRQAVYTGELRVEDMGWEVAHAA
ncbi:hypothetical protein [uncultured Meiothermus sp.]|jgi:hypothetical protein|uniref:hypothetical protein n=1 Tax=uncultured Meiothermus sp. TaxID=157471 RepID=UPI002639AB34|nr:hypothetical protein [uncultured Meiothermus sp.]